MALVWENEDCSVHFSEYKTAFLHYHGPVTEPSFRVCFSRFQRVQGGHDIAIAGECRTLPRSRFPEWDDLTVYLDNAGFSDHPVFIDHLKESIISRAKSIAQDRDQEPLINVVLRVYTTNEEVLESDHPAEMMTMIRGARTEESESDQEYNYSDDDDYDDAEYSDMDLDHGLMVQDNVLKMKKMASPEAIEGWKNKALDEVESKACCVICFQNLGRLVKVTPCGHYYHQTCIFQWLNTSSACPLCRFQLRCN